MNFWIFDLNLWSLNFWMVGSLVLFSVGVTLFTDWLAAGLPRRRGRAWPALTSLVANLIWILLVFVAGAIAVRYIERMSNAVVGYLVFGLAAFLLSLLRAILYRRDQKQPGPGLSDSLVHNLAYLLFAVVFYLLFAWLARRRIEPVLFIPLCLGALSPDLDSRTSPLGRLLPFISRPLAARFGRRQEWHTLATNALVAVVTAPLILALGALAWGLFSLGFLAHLLLDLMTPEGLMLFWPLTRRRFSVLGLVTSPGCKTERVLVAVLTVLTVLLLFGVDWGPPPPPPARPLSYEETLAQYYGMRGRTLVLADVDGSWQATGRRVRWTFEVLNVSGLNASGQSFVLLDRYTGDVFTAGRAATDNFYLDHVTLKAGDPVRVKPVEVHLERQPLADALPVLYQMQREPGLQHIFVSGDVSGPALPVDYAQTTLRRIRLLAAGHYRLDYLTASQLVGLANVQVERADLVIVATYTTSATGPTVTPLPSPPTTPEPGP